MPHVESSGDTQTDANQNWPKSATQHHRKDAGARSTHGHADSDLVGSAGHEERNHSVQTNRRQSQGKGTEEAREPRDQAILIEVSGNLGIVGSEIEDS